ncbi:FecR domain-containing protein [Mariniflexile soesokkakense]|uniref:FecR domain-containing protein n=1 Tax=Mariniflexile soesokkakense TaxID=1343160 RepID=A0ABV0AB70_9FLAO
MDKEQLMGKWLKGELNDSEKEIFSKLDDAQLNGYIIDNAQHFKASHFFKLNDFDTFKRQYKSSKAPVEKLNGFSALLKVASVIVISLGIYFTFFSNSLSHFETLAGEKSAFELPDHSKVELNALSSIEFNTKNWDDNRFLMLDGEAYFMVSKGKTFNVKTKSGTVTVVGTQFNVKQRDNFFEVKCFEGIVKVTSDTITRKLLEGDVYQILNGKFTQSKVLTSAPKWTDNRSEFEAIPIKEVLSELERQYNVQVTFKNIDTNRLFTGGFVHNNLENALIAITQPMNMTYELSSSKLVIIHGKEH